MDQIFDLFGDPIAANHGKRGRPEHVPTQESRNKVNMLLALGWGNERIANALRISEPTLRKHYFSELKCRDVARDRLTAATATTLWDQFQGGNVAAAREFNRLVERNDLALGIGVRAPSVSSEDGQKAEKLGKKELAEREAQSAGASAGWGALLQ